MNVDNSKNHVSTLKITLKNNFICHLVYEHDFIQQFNDMIVEKFDLREHLFIVYAKHAWDKTREYNIRNSYYIDSFDDAYLIELIEKSAQIIVHCLYTIELTDFLFQNYHLLNKVNWKLWGGDLYLYRQVCSGYNSEENEAKRMSIIKNIAYITSPVEEEFKHAIDVYKGDAKYKFAFYPLPKDFCEYRLAKNQGKNTTINILVGNSGYPTNNHLQAFSYLSKFRNEQIKIYCPLSYGDKDYSKKVCVNGRKIFDDKFVPLLNFIQFDQYVNLMNTMDLAVMNHNRQQGLGTILTLLYLGKKVYMQPHITTYKCLKRFGVAIYDIDEIEKSDLSNLKTFSRVCGKINYEIIGDIYSKDNCINSWQAIFSDALRTNSSKSKMNIGTLQKILFVNHNLYPYEISGTPLSTLNHAVGAAQRGLEVAVLIPSNGIGNGYRKKWQGQFTLYQIAAIDKFVAYFADLGQNEMSEYRQTIEQIIDDFQPQVVHINDYVYMPAEIIEIFSSKGCIVVREVCNCEELCHRDYPVISNGLKNELCMGPESSRKCALCFYAHRDTSPNYAIYKESLPFIEEKIDYRFQYIANIYNNIIDAVIFTSEPFKTYFTKFVPVIEDKIKIIPRGLKFNFPRKKRSIKKHNDLIHFAFIGNILFSKGIDILFNAFEKICNEYNFILHVYGEIISSEYLNWISNLQTKHSDKFIYHGGFRSDELLKTDLNIDICIVPSYFDTYNRVIREMFYLGIPVIATDFLGANVVEDGRNGFRIPVGDADALAEKMISIINDPALVETLSNAVAQTNIPSIDEEIDQLVETYKDVFKKYNLLQDIKIKNYNNNPDSNKFANSTDCNYNTRLFYEIKINNLEKQLDNLYKSNGVKFLLKYYSLRDLFFPEKSFQKKIFINIFGIVIKFLNKFFKS